MTLVIKWYNNQIQELSLSWVSIFTLWEIYFMNHEIFGRGKNNTFRKELLYQEGTIKGTIMAYRKDQLSFSPPINDFPYYIK